MYCSQDLYMHTTTLPRITYRYCNFDLREFLFTFDFNISPSMDIDGSTSIAAPRTRESSTVKMLVKKIAGRGARIEMGELPNPK